MSAPQLEERATVPRLASRLSPGDEWFALEYDRDARVLWLLDQRRLPQTESYLGCATVDDVAWAIQAMVVRGAPAIGLAAAYGLVLLAQRELGPAPSFTAAVGIAARALSQTRPTAVNLERAVSRMLTLAVRVAPLDPEARAQALCDEARQMHREDVAANRAMSARAVAELPRELRILTHCNTGALATGGWGTALGVIRELASMPGRLEAVYATETRPFLQGARLTAWELHRDHIGLELLTDAMPAALMAQGKINAVVVGADRITARGDVANKIGTLALALAARHYALPFLVIAPWTTVDPTLESGSTIPIEQRASDEAAQLFGQRIAPEGVSYLHPAFDVTPASLVTAIVTERGVFRPAEGDRLCRGSERALA